MKDFFKYTAATVVGIIVFTIVCVALSVMSIVGMVASASATQAVEKNSVLVLKLNGSIDEQGTDNTIGKLTGNYIPSTGLNDIGKHKRHLHRCRRIVNRLCHTAGNTLSA